MYQGLKALDCKVVWILRGFKLPEENPNFFVGDFLPQVEILAHPGIKGGLTHCGFGGTLEFLMAGVPIVCWPHFADQHDNSKTLVSAGVGIELYNKQELDPAKMLLMTIPNQVFDATKVTATFKEALSNPSYQKACQRLQAQVKTSGGIDLAIQTIERAYISGTDHLVDEPLLSKIDKTSNCCFCWSMCFSVALLAFLIFSTVMYLTDETVISN